MTTHGPVITLTGLPGVGKSTVANLLISRLDPSAVLISEHSSSLVTAVNEIILGLAEPRSHFGLTTSLAYVLYEYKVALTAPTGASALIVRDRGVEDTRLVLSSAAEHGAVPLELLDELLHPALLHADLLILLEADQVTRRKRIRHRHQSPLGYEAALRFDAEFGATFADTIGAGSEAKFVRVDASLSVHDVTTKVHSVITHELGVI